MKEVVIIGGGYGGSEVAKRLDAKYQSVVHVTLIDSRQYQVHKISGLRGAVDPNWVEPTLVPRDQLLHGNNRFVNGTVAQVKDGLVEMEDGTTIKYDVLVCATGGQNVGPGEPAKGLTSLEQMKTFYKNTAEVLKRNKKVTLIGGGPVAIEFAGEIRDKFPSTEITIVNATKDFVSSANPPFPDSFQKKLKARLDKRNIKYILGEKVEMDFASFNDKPFLEGVGSIQTSSGKSIPTDVVFLCTGYRLNTSIYPSEFLNENGQVKVTPTLQVVGKTNVFALGDITDIKELKVGYLANQAHAPVVTENVISVAKGVKPVKTHKPMAKPMMLIPIGKSVGVMVTPLGVIGSGMLVSMIKGKSLFVSMSWKSNNRTAPKVKN